MIIALDHIAIATDDLQAAIARFAEDFGIELSGTEDVEPAKTSTAFFPISGTRIEMPSTMCRIFCPSQFPSSLTP